MNRNELAKQAHANAIAKGFYDNKPSVESLLMLVICEVAELVEADRKGKVAKRRQFDKELNHLIKTGWSKTSVGYNDAFVKEFEIFIKNSIEDKMADIYIRLLDLAGEQELDLEHLFTLFSDGNGSNEAGLYSFPEHAYCLVLHLMGKSRYEQISCSMRFVELWAKHLNIDLSWHVEMKMKYNKSRERLRGKRY